MLIETTGRVSGKQRRTIVGAHRDGSTLWIVAEQGWHAGYVRNLSTAPAVRVRLRGRWRAASATVVPDDDPVARLATFGDDKHAALVQKFRYVATHDPRRPARLIAQLSLSSVKDSRCE